MIHVVPLRILRYYLDRPFTHTGSHLRGAVLRQFPDREALHNRRADGIARLPEVRFLVRESVPHIVALGPGRDAVLELYRGLCRIRADVTEYAVEGAELLDAPQELGVADELFRYRSATHWLGLNQQNYGQYRALRGARDRRALLERILVGNALVAFRQLDVELAPTERILASITGVRERMIRVKASEFLGLKVEVTTNLAWSPWLGLGKQVAKGFGLLEQVSD